MVIHQCLKCVSPQVLCGADLSTKKNGRKSAFAWSAPQDTSHKMSFLGRLEAIARNFEEHVSTIPEKSQNACYKQVIQLILERCDYTAYEFAMGPFCHDEAAMYEKLVTSLCGILQILCSGSASAFHNPDPDFFIDMHQRIAKLCTDFLSDRNMIMI